MSKFCGNCGCELEDGDLFCKDCGADLNDAEIKDAAGEKAEDVKEAVDDVEETVDDIKEAVDDVEETVDDIKEATDDVKETVDEVKEAVEEKAEDVAETAADNIGYEANTPAAPIPPATPAKKGKKALIIVIISLAALAVIAALLWFFVFGKASLVGKWEFRQNIIDSLTNSENTEEYAVLTEKIDKEINITCYYTFDDDGSFKMTVKKGDFKDKFEELIGVYVDSICEDPEEMLASLGATVESLEAMGMTVDQYVELVRQYSLSQLNSQIDTLVDKFEDDAVEGEKIISKGTYKFEDGVISVDYEGEGVKDGSLTVSIGRCDMEIEKDELTVSGALAGIVMNKID